MLRRRGSRCAGDGPLAAFAVLGKRVGTRAKGRLMAAAALIPHSPEEPTDWTTLVQQQPDWPKKGRTSRAASA
jgi:hypothetical protein